MSNAIERKIRAEFSPYLVTARHHHRWMPYRVYVGYAYLGEVCVALAGFGLATPVSALIAHAQAAPEAGGVASNAVTGLGWMSLALLLIWVVVKVYVHHERLDKRCSLRSSYGRQCRQMEEELLRALREDDPMPKLLTLQAKLNDLVDRSMAEDAITDGVDRRRKQEWEQYAEDLIVNYSGNWIVSDNTERRVRKLGATP